MNLVKEFIVALEGYLGKAKKKSDSLFHDNELTLKKIIIAQQFYDDFTSNEVVQDYLLGRNRSTLAGIRRVILRLQAFNIILEDNHLMTHRSYSQNRQISERSYKAFFHTTNIQSSLQRLTEKTVAKIDKQLLAEDPRYVPDNSFSGFFSLIQYLSQQISWYLANELNIDVTTEDKHSLNYKKYILGIKARIDFKNVGIAVLDRTSLPDALNQLTFLVRQLKQDNHDIEAQHHKHHVSLKDNAHLGFSTSLERATLLQSRLQLKVEDFEDVIDKYRQQYNFAPAPLHIAPLILITPTPSLLTPPSPPGIAMADLGPRVQAQAPVRP